MPDMSLTELGIPMPHLDLPGLDTMQSQDQRELDLRDSYSVSVQVNSIRNSTGNYSGSAICPNQEARVSYRNNPRRWETSNSAGLSNMSSIQQAESSQNRALLHYY